MKDGLRSYCKDCVKKYDRKSHKEYYQKNKEELKRKMREYNKNNPEKGRAYRRKNKEKLAKYNKEWRKENYHRYWVNATLGNHKRKGHIINIKPDELEQLAKNTNYCPICGIKIKWYMGGKNKKPNSPTLDRIENKNEININNIQIICDKCNVTKQDRTMKEFVEYCAKVSNRFAMKYILGG